MEDYFRKYHKFIGAQEHLQPRVDQAQQEVVRLEAKLSRLEQGIVDPEVGPKTRKTSESPISPAPGQPKPNRLRPMVTGRIRPPTDCRY